MFRLGVSARVNGETMEELVTTFSVVHIPGLPSAVSGDEFMHRWFRYECRHTVNFCLKHHILTVVLPSNLPVENPGPCEAGFFSFTVLCKK